MRARRISVANRVSVQNALTMVFFFFLKTSIVFPPDAKENDRKIGAKTRRTRILNEFSLFRTAELRLFSFHQR